jgi:DNA-binding MarR family transcriptional regulator
MQRKYFDILTIRNSNYKDANEMPYSSDQCAREVLETVPLAMRNVRSELRKHRGGDLSVPQFRTLFYVSRHEGTSLSAVADHVGLTLPSMSRIVDMLVARKLATRTTHRGDRRRMTLTLTNQGRATLQSARKATESYLRDLFEAVSSEKRVTVVEAMRILRPIFSSSQSGEIGG